MSISTEAEKRSADELVPLHAADQATAYLRAHRNTACRCLREGRLRGARTGLYCRFTPDSVNEFVAS